MIWRCAGTALGLRCRGDWALLWRMAYWASMRHIPHVWNQKACCLCCPDIAAAILPDPETAILAVEIAKHDIWDKQHLPEHIRRFAQTAHFKGSGQKLIPMNPFYPYLDNLGQDMEQAAGRRDERTPAAEDAMGAAPHGNREPVGTVAGRNHWQQARFLFWLEPGENGASFYCVPVRTVWKQWYKPMYRAYEGCGPPEV